MQCKQRAQDDLKALKKLKAEKKIPEYRKQMRQKCSWQQPIRAIKYLEGASKQTPYTPCKEKADRRLERATQKVQMAQREVSKAKLALEAAQKEQRDAYEQKLQYLHYDVANARYCCASDPENVSQISQYVQDVFQPAYDKMDHNNQTKYKSLLNYAEAVLQHRKHPPSKSAAASASASASGGAAASTKGKGETTHK